MSRELTLGCSLAYEDADGSAVSLTLSQIFANVTTEAFSQFKLSVPTGNGIAIPLPDNPISLGWLIAVNRDATNFVTLLDASAGNVIAKMLPGEPCFFRLGTNMQTPYLAADTAACNVDGIVVAT